jgi:hypothetical protein
MKKTAVALIFTLALFFSVIAGTETVNLTKANPETLTNASISIQSPEDESIMIQKAYS